MSVKLNIPAPLRQYCDQKKTIEVNAGSIKDILSAIEKDYNLLYSKVCDEEGNVRQYVNIYINGIDIKKQDNLQTTVKENDTINIIPAVAGGLVARC